MSHLEFYCPTIEGFSASQHVLANKKPSESARLVDLGSHWAILILAFRNTDMVMRCCKANSNITNDFLQKPSKAP